MNGIAVLFIISLILGLIAEIITCPINPACLTANIGQEVTSQIAEQVNSPVTGYINLAWFAINIATWIATSVIIFGIFLGVKTWFERL